MFKKFHNKEYFLDKLGDIPMRKFVEGIEHCALVGTEEGEEKTLLLTDNKELYNIFVDMIKCE